MSAVLELAEEVVAVRPAVGPRLVKVGIVGLGQVGQAVARLAPAAARLRDAGWRFRVVSALVRDVDKPRRCARPRLTSNPSAFLRGNYDVVIEALGAVEPARSIVSRLLGRGVPVVTANKALVAVHGPELSALAARRGTAFRYEASALAGVPFLGALAARPLVSDVQRFTAVVNGTSNFILSRLEREGHDFASALAEAQALGLTEPDPSRDLDGRDAADKLLLLASLFGWGAVSRSRLDVQGISDLTPQDLATAAALGGTIKPVVQAALTAAGVSAFIGPAFVPARHPLAALSGTLAGIQLSGRFISELYFSGPGAGPDITAATVLDDAVEAVSSAPNKRRLTASAPPAATAAPPATEWLVRTRFPGFVPDAAAVSQVFSGAHFNVLHVTEAIGDSRWVRLAATTRGALDAALATIQGTHRIHCLALRAL